MIKGVAVAGSLLFIVADTVPQMARIGSVFAVTVPIDLETGKQIPNWAWEFKDGIWRRKVNG
jgi:hypothetical protein